MELAASFSTPGVWARSAPSSTHLLTGSRNLRRPAHHHPARDSPPVGLSYSLSDSLGNQLYTTTGVYPPNGATASYLQTTY
jgi:hypothetical protein